MTTQDECKELHKKIIQNGKRLRSDETVILDGARYYIDRNIDMPSSMGIAMRGILDRLIKNK